MADDDRRQPDEEPTHDETPTTGPTSGGTDTSNTNARIRPTNPEPTRVFSSPSSWEDVGEIRQGARITVTCQTTTGDSGSRWDWLGVAAGGNWPAGTIVREDVEVVPTGLPNCDTESQTSGTKASEQSDSTGSGGPWAARIDPDNPRPTRVFSSATSWEDVGQIPQGARISIVCQRYTGDGEDRWWWYRIQAGPSWPSGAITALDVETQPNGVPTC